MLLRQLPAGLSQQSPPLVAAQNLTDCLVTLEALLNFRDGPYGAVKSVLPARVRLTALAQFEDWFQVDYHGERGWVSADYVTTQGNCG